jgi:hypothetical protein
LGATGDLRGCFRCSHAFLSWTGDSTHQTLEALEPLRPAAVTSSLGLTEPQIAALVESIQLETIETQRKK